MHLTRGTAIFLATLALATACAGEGPDRSHRIRFRTVALTWGAGDSLGAALIAARLGVGTVGVLGPEQGVAPRDGEVVLSEGRDGPSDRAAVAAWLRRRAEVASVRDEAR